MIIAYIYHILCNNIPVYHSIITLFCKGSIKLKFDLKKISIFISPQYNIPCHHTVGIYINVKYND